MTETVTQEEFYDRLDDVQSGMLAIGDVRPVPMSHYIDRDTNTLWFITARGTDMVNKLQAGPQKTTYVVACGHAKLYGTIEGTAQLSNDRAKLEEIWNPVADSWFEGGIDDPDLRLFRLDLSEAEVWATTGAVGFLYELAKAQFTDDKPDMGAHGTLRFAA